MIPKAKAYLIVESDCLFVACSKARVSLFRENLLLLLFASSFKVATKGSAFVLDSFLASFVFSA